MTTPLVRFTGVRNDAHLANRKHCGGRRTSLGRTRRMAAFTVCLADIVPHPRERIASFQRTT